MHLSGGFLENATGICLLYLLIINTIFNIGVSEFALISGNFGIKYNLNKIIKLWTRMFIYSTLSLVIMYFLGEKVSLGKVINHMTPFIHVGYWYITVYLLLMLFSGYINKFIDKLSKMEFAKLLTLMIMVLSFIPTLVFGDIFHDGGKGLPNILLLYLVGRYIHKYYTNEFHTPKLLLLLIGILITEFFLNFSATAYVNRNGNTGVFAPFSKDLSFFVFSSSIVLFMIFKNFVFKSNLINLIAKHVLGIYLLNFILITILTKFINLANYCNEWYFFIISGICAVDIMTIAIIIDKIYELILEKFCLKVSNFIIKQIFIKHFAMNIYTFLYKL